MQNIKFDECSDEDMNINSLPYAFENNAIEEYLEKPKNVISFSARSVVMPKKTKWLTLPAKGG